MKNKHLFAWTAVLGAAYYLTKKRQPKPKAAASSALPWKGIPYR